MRESLCVQSLFTPDEKERFAAAVLRKKLRQDLEEQYKTAKTKAS